MSGFLETVLHSTPRSSNTNLTALEAPPLPKISARSWCPLKKGLISCLKPNASVLNPFSFPSVIETVLTAPICAAIGSISSRCGMIDSLNGMVTFRPLKSFCVSIKSFISWIELSSKLSYS